MNVHRRWKVAIFIAWRDGVRQVSDILARIVLFGVYIYLFDHAANFMANDLNPITYTSSAGYFWLCGHYLEARRRARHEANLRYREMVQAPMHCPFFMSR